MRGTGPGAAGLPSMRMWITERSGGIAMGERCERATGVLPGARIPGRSEGIA